MMGGTSGVLTADTKEELIAKATEWYRGALGSGLHPRKFIYAVNTILDIKVGHSSKVTGYLTVFDMNDTKNILDAALSETKYPFGIYSEGLSAEAKGKRFFGFVSAHS